MFWTIPGQSPTNDAQRVRMAAVRRMRYQCDYLRVELDSQITQLVSAARYIDHYDNSAVPVRGGTRSKIPRAATFSVNGNAQPPSNLDQTRQQMQNVDAGNTYAQCLQSAKDCIIAIEKLKAEGDSCGLASSLKGLPIAKSIESSSADSRKLVSYAKAARQWPDTFAGRARARSNSKEAGELKELKKKLFGDAPGRARRAKARHNTV